MIANCIKSHNFIDDDGKDMEFNEAMVRQLPDDDLLALSCAVTGKTMEELQKVAESGNVSDSEKKKSIDKNRVFDLLLEGKSVTPKNSFQREAVKRFNDIYLCREFGWTPYDIAEMPVDFYEDTLLLLSKEAAIKKRQQEEYDKKTR